FFSSRRRHTRSKRDWSSDVCSSDLRLATLLPRERARDPRVRGEHHGREIGGHEAVFGEVVLDQPAVVAQALWQDPVVRAADELVLVLPLGPSPAEQQELLRVFGALVVPPLQMVLSR